MFEDIAAGQGANLLTAIAVVGVALVALYVVTRLMRSRSNATFIRGGRNRQPRLAVLDAAAVDARRRLVLVRRDDVEHLILIGGPTDLVVESRIGAPVTQSMLGATGEEPRAIDGPRDRTFGDALASIERSHEETAPSDEPAVRIVERPAASSERSTVSGQHTAAAAVTPAPAPIERPAERQGAIERPLDPKRSDPVISERPSAPTFEPANQSRIAPPVPVPPAAPVPAPVPVPAFTGVPQAAPRPPMAVVPSRDPVLDPAPDAGQIREQAIDALDQARARVLVEPEPPVTARATEVPVVNVNPFSEYEDIAADIPEPAPRAPAAEPARAAEPPRPAAPVVAAITPTTAATQRTTDQVMSDFEAVLEAELAGDLSSFSPGRPTVAPPRPITVAPPHAATGAGEDGRTPLDDEMDRLLGDLSRRP